MKYTKGPWQYGGSASKEIYRIETGDSLCKMTYHSMWPPEWQEANARLIASAPDLLEACKYVREQLKTVKGKTFPIMPILNAIAKAEGETK